MVFEQTLTIGNNLGNLALTMEQIKIDLSGATTDKIGNEHGLTKDDIEHGLSRAKGLSIDYPFIALPTDKKTVAQIKHVSEMVKCKFQNLVVLGIGGSALGLKCLAQSLLAPHYNMLESNAREGCPRLFVMDNIDPDHFSATLKMLNWKETCVNVISKSGKTTETLSQFYIVKDILIKKFGAHGWKEHVIITTDPNSGPLRVMATEEKLQSFSVPFDVGGRFSVLSSVGLFPAASSGIDICELLDGAADMAGRCKSIDENNPALMNAVIHYLMGTSKQKNISVMMPYSDSLSLFADWYSQLWAESLGKNGAGPTPVKAVGVTDQHSQLQLYMEGPNNKIITIVGVENFGSKISVPKDVPKDYSYLASKELGAILHAEQNATTMALQKASRPVVNVTLPNLSAHSLGQLLMMYQIQTAIAGHLYGINPFDQPGVELGKRLTREILCNP